MGVRCRPACAIVALGFMIAACGTAAEPSRLKLRTPGANTGAPLAPTPVPTPTAKRKPVTKTEERVIRAWSNELRHGRVTAAARYFAVPSLVVNDSPTASVLRSRDAVKAFNRGLRCGGKLIRTRRGADDFVVGIFRQTERPGAGACAEHGELAQVAFLIQKRHITWWVRVGENETAPGATATPSPTPTPTPTATATPTATPTPTPSATPTDTPTPIPTNAAGLPALA